MSARAAGISYEELCLQLLAGATLDSARAAAAAEPDAWPPPRSPARPTSPLPPDVRLMNATAAVLAARRRGPGRGDGAAVAGAPAAVRDPRDQRRRRRRRATASRRCAPTPRRSSPATSSRCDLRRGAARVRVGAVGAPWRSCAASGRTGSRCSSRSTGRSRSGAARAATEKLVNSFGEVFEANVGDVEDDALPTFAGPDGSSAHVLAMLGRVDGRARAARRARRGADALGPRLVAGDARQRRGVELGRGSDDDVIAARGALRRARVDQVDRRATSARSSTPTCATPTATRCG